MKSIVSFWMTFYSGSTKQICINGNFMSTLRETVSLRFTITFMLPEINLISMSGKSRKPLKSLIF